MARGQGSGFAKEPHHIDVTLEHGLPAMLPPWFASSVCNEVVEMVRLLEAGERGRGVAAA